MALLWAEIPAWRFGGTEPLATGSVAYSQDALTCPGGGEHIAIYGDSHVVGGRMAQFGGESGPAYGRVLEAELRGGATVSLHGVGGHTAPMGESRWNIGDSKADLVLIAYGTNDAAPRGWLRSKKPVALSDFTAAMERLASTASETERQVVFLAPPPAGSSAIMQRLQPYREALRDLGRQLDSPVLDPADAFAACESSQPLLIYDALHMTASGHRCLGEWLAARLCNAPN
ncbi:SGNH/GDSL hydrolase family protein [Erythrobacter sp. KY5]|uniref:SGNH/GDSL hydrolase family protein n=1 Tax=Erythrobacter sp. KY5 TaxID=2011159 RepID=UPI0018F87862|nr:SGNH/GDSL hydrolase family protein [Erythrobacter sp. KY5]